MFLNLSAIPTAGQHKKHIVFTFLLLQQPFTDKTLIYNTVPLFLRD